MPPPFTLLRWVLSTCAVVSAHSQAATADDVEFFRREVNPILQEHCRKCHGGEKIKGGLVLTSRAGLLKGGESGAVVDLGAPGQSRLLAMMSYQDADHEMPPAGKRPAAELAVIARWLTRGAPYDPALETEAVGVSGNPTSHQPSGNDHSWWAYQPVRANSAPKNTDATWSRHPVDAFLYKGLADAGLRPNPRASREHLARRAYYDLTGLPPSTEDVQAFVNDATAEAWPRLIDALLAKPQYGEKWARHWMDVVRYAETEGFERDSEKRYIWRYRDYLINAFNQDIPFNQFITEQLAGDEIPTPTRSSVTATAFLRLMPFDDEPADRLLAKYDVLGDIVQVTSEAFLGMTMGCARCHDHKKDPITQRDYSSFLAFFHGISDYGTSRKEPMQWFDQEDEPRLKKQRAESLSALNQELHRVEAIVIDWYKKQAPTSPAPPILASNQGEAKGEWRYTLTAPSANWREENFVANDWGASPSGPEPRATPIWQRAQFALNDIPKLLALDLEFAGDTEVFLNGTAVLQAPNLPAGQRVLQLTARFVKLLHTGMNTLAVKTTATNGNKLPRVNLLAGRTFVTLAESLLKGPQKNELPGLTQRVGSDPLALLKTQSSAWLAEAERPLGIPLNAMSEIPQPPPLFVHRRGNPHNLGEPVEPAFPAILARVMPPPPAIAPRTSQATGQLSSGRRLALAQWMTDPANPLVSRVAVNRVWQHHFARGLVPTANDFGRLGEKPSHPELLDWLAHEFTQNGWSLKKLHRLIMTSEAYQQSVTASPVALAQDPENRLLGRFSMRRLTAEEIRDSILLLSATLKPDMFGPPVYPPLPQAVLETQSRPGSGWPKQTSAQAARRSIYVHVKRSLAVPLLADHDQAATDTSCAARFATTVPTQALGLLNSDFMEEHSRLFAQRLRREAGDDRTAQVQRGLTLALQRAPLPAESALCLRTLRTFENEFQLSPEGALQRFALLALNLNEFLYLD
ncbi:MAG: hypothetical protein RL077_1444 [Verrucomicrobiota bacterium]